MKKLVIHLCDRFFVECGELIMRKLRTLIVDDEPLALRLLKSKLSKIDCIDVVGECKNGREAIAATLDLAPDLLFLDIQMPGINGLDVVKKLQNDVVPPVVFTTAYEQYALDAFDVHAVDYILKPLDDERIQRAVDRAVQRLQSA
jgi:two-component system LytT family response regulator